MNDQDELIALYRQENEAMVNKDIVTLNNFSFNHEPATHDRLCSA